MFLDMALSCKNNEHEFSLALFSLKIFFTAIVIVNEIILFSLTNIFVTLQTVNENHTGLVRSPNTVEIQTRRPTPYRPSALFIRLPSLIIISTNNITISQPVSPLWHTTSCTESH